MRRRALLATLGSVALAGCGERTYSPSTERRPDPLTPPANVTVYTEGRPMPEAPESPTVETAREFVATHEEHLVYNQLIGKADTRVRVSGYDYPTSVSVEPATTQVVHETDAGVYLLSSCSGEAEYYCEDRDPNGGCGRGAGRNAHAVTHFVGDGEHRRVPFNAYACKEISDPYASDDPTENVPLDDHDRAAKLNIYDFTGLHPTVDAEITHAASGDLVLSKSYDLSLQLAVQADVTRRRGVYEVEATIDGVTVHREWTVTDREAASWTGLCVYATPDGEPVIVIAGKNGSIGLPESMCRRPRTESEPKS